MLHPIGLSSFVADTKTAYAVHENAARWRLHEKPPHIFTISNSYEANSQSPKMISCSTAANQYGLMMICRQFVFHSFWRQNISANPAVDFVAGVSYALDGGKGQWSFSCSSRSERFRVAANGGVSCLWRVTITR